MTHPTFLGDARQLAFCALCGGAVESRDHTPPRVFLDDPLPENLPIVGACYRCNNGHSADESYLACLVECVVRGSADPVAIQRPKIRRLLETKPRLAARLHSARKVIDGRTVFDVETDRVRRVLIKIARGHALFELNEIFPEEPSYVSFSPLDCMSHQNRYFFEHPTSAELALWPEVGSRAMHRLVEKGGVDWIVIQPNRYRYLTSAGIEGSVRMVIGEYLAAEVKWSDST